MQLSILQWNIWTKENPSNVLSLIHKYQPDIICLQELTQNFESTGYLDVPQYLGENLEYNYYYGVAHDWVDGTNRNQGNGIFSRFPISNTQKIFLKRSNSLQNDYSQEGRILASAKIVLGKKNLIVATTHLSYADGLQENLEKISEGEILLQTLSEKKGSLIFSGDLNINENSKLIDKLQKSLRHAGPVFDQKTWTTKPFKYHGFEENELKWRLDYVFTTPDIQIIDSRIIQTQFSDHLPILVTFEI